jgi:hypothetical protein
MPVVEDAAAGRVLSSQARQRYGLLLVSLLVSLGVQGVAAPTAGQQVLVAGLIGISLLLAVWAAGLPPRLMVAATVLGVALLVVSVVQAATGDIGEGASRGMNALLVALGPPAVAYGVVRSLRTSGEVKVEAVMGVLSLYMLLGMLFAFVFGAIDRYDGPFFTGDVPATVSNCLYYSFTTLTTVGYGDFTARSDLGHTLSVFEALIGQIYLVTVVSLIVGNLRQRLPERT